LEKILLVTRKNEMSERNLKGRKKNRKFVDEKNQKGGGGKGVGSLLLVKNVRNCEGNLGTKIA